MLCQVERFACGHVTRPDHERAVLLANRLAQFDTLNQGAWHHILIPEWRDFNRRSALEQQNVCRVARVREFRRHLHSKLQRLICELVLQRDLTRYGYPLRVITDRMELAAPSHVPLALR